MALASLSASLGVPCFSPLHEGDASVATWQLHLGSDLYRFQSPSRGGRLCGGEANPRRDKEPLGFQSPSRGGRLCGDTGARPSPGDFVSVPFTRGTPLWPRPALLAPL